MPRLTVSMPVKVCLRIRPPGSRLAHVVGIEIAVQGEILAPEAAGDVEQQVFVAVVVVGHQAVGIVARGGDQQAEARHAAGAGDGEAALAVAAAFGEQIQLRRGLGLAGDEIDHAGVRIRSVDRRLRAAHHIDVVHRLAGDVGEIEAQPAAEADHRHAIDLHQAQIGIAAADEQAGHAAGRAGLIERHAGQVAQQVHGEGLVGRAHARVGNHVHAGGLQRSWGTSMVEPTTCTESTRGAISSWMSAASVERQRCAC